MAREGSARGTAGTEGPGLLTCIPGSRTWFLGLGPLARNPCLTGPAAWEDAQGRLHGPILFSAGPAGPALVPNASHPVPSPAPAPQVITCITKEEKRSQKDMGDVSEDE